MGEATNILYSAGPSTTAERWNHDLHDLLENDASHHKQPLPIVEDISRRNLPTNNSSAKGPEPLSRTVTLGHLTLRVSIPGMSSPIAYDKMPLKYHIRLPDLRPPLRRDKPVRVSLPPHTPRYIFPSIDRSFIFIPRAQRPNQQAGRRPFSSRRNSVFGGSSYTPSVAMSRRSSAAARDGIISPATSSYSKAPFHAPPIPSRPVVNLPLHHRAAIPAHQYGMIYNGSHLAPTDGVSEAMHPPPGKPTFQSQWTGQLPVHQPRPQKTVSVTTIESPSKENLHAPQQQEQQPFHHQVPGHVNSTKPQEFQPAYQPQGSWSYSGVPAPDTPANLPDGAVNAQPFQPDQGQMFYSGPYPMQEMMIYPSTDVQSTTQYTGQPMMAQPIYMQPTPQGSYLVPMVDPSAVPHMNSVGESPMGANAYESNGTVYFYDPSQYGNGTVANSGYTQHDPNNSEKNGNEVYYPMDYYPTQ